MCFYSRPIINSTFTNLDDIDFIMAKLKVSDELFTLYVKESFSISEVLLLLGLVGVGGNYKTFHARVKKLNIDTSHFIGQSHLKGKTHNWSKIIPLSEILIENSLYSSSLHLKNRLFRENLLPNKCSNCGIDQWDGKSISLHLDHINGINNDNRLDNLRILCPNCHSQTDTYCVKNRKKCAPKTIYNCITCNKELSEKRKTDKCIKCYRK